MDRPGQADRAGIVVPDPLHPVHDVAETDLTHVHLLPTSSAGELNTGLDAGRDGGASGVRDLSPASGVGLTDGIGVRATKDPDARGAARQRAPMASFVWLLRA